jgi:hypothetical protein
LLFHQLSGNSMALKQRGVEATRASNEEALQSKRGQPVFDVVRFDGQD